MGRKKVSNPSLGRALMNRKKVQFNRQTNADQTTKEESTAGLKSVTEESSYDEFIATAALANKDFSAEKLNIKFVTLSTNNADDLNATDVTEEEKKMVVVPRRPPWNTEMTPEELDEAEKEVFLQWRRSMAVLQEKEGITPFERNIEVWRQLWRVVEKSDIVIQIVDARNPLMYRCEDLEKYVKEMGKQPVLLINKADFLDEQQRSYWDQYFTSIELPHAFYSAKRANDVVELKRVEKDSQTRSADVVEDAKHEESSKSEDDDEEISEEDGAADDENEVRNGENDTHINQNRSKDSKAIVSQEPLQKTEPTKFAPFGTEVLDRDKLVEFLYTFKTADMMILHVGLVGYPNVGKSSTINSLMALKKTSVSSTPGKTKHFQTLYLNGDILLCDCPGLVMPAFGGSKGAMVLGGILPIDQLTNYAPAMALLAQQIPRRVLESKYGISLSKDYNFEDIVSAYAHIRGFMTARGLPDSSRAARIILKDYVDGKLVYCHAPPNVNQAEFQPVAPAELEPLRQETSFAKTTIRKANLEKILDSQFFAPSSSTAHTKGKLYISSGISSASSSTSGLSEKPWKKHHNRNKKEKLRRVYRHLDVE